MDRRQFMKFVGANGSAVLFSLSGCSSFVGMQGSTRRPNIIFLLTDDQRWDSMSCAGNAIIRTPNIDGLAKGGVLFTNAFVTTSICCSSRASIFSGQYSRRHGIWDFDKDFSPSAWSQTYLASLKAAGYRTGFIGKFGVGRNMPAGQFDYWRGFAGQGQYEHKDSNGNYEHLTSIMGDQSLEFLRGCSKQQPFCLSVSFKAPHVQDGDPRQFVYDPVFKDLYKDAHIPVPETADPKYFESLPEFFKKDNEARRRWQIRFSTGQMYQESVKGYYRLIAGVDVVIAQIRSELRKLGFADNTVIIFTSDNGFYLGEHGLAGKWYGHEESIRVPLIVCDPRLPRRRRGRICSEMVLNIDIAPTVLALAGIGVPACMQGRSLCPLVNGQGVKWRDEFFYEHLFDYERIPKSEGVVTRRFKYMRYIEQQPVYEELFDLSSDPREVRNLARDTQYHGILGSMRKKCDKLLEEARGL